MSAPPAIRVCPVTPALREAVLRLHVRPEQDCFVSPPARTLPDAEQCPGSEPMVILLGDTPIGYYRIERSARSLTGHDDDADALGLRSFQLDAAWQGRGLGMLALDALRESGPWLCGEAVTLADLHLAPVLAYLVLAREGRDLLAGQAGLSRWWERMAARPSMAATRSALEDAAA